jgi:hypothetical protein
MLLYPDLYKKDAIHGVDYLQAPVAVVTDATVIEIHIERVPLSRFSEDLEDTQKENQGTA